MTCSGCLSHQSTIEANVALINVQKTQLDRLSGKCAEISDEAEAKQDKLDELEMRLGLSDMKLSDEEQLSKIRTLEKKIRVFVEENIKLKASYEKLKSASMSQRDEYVALKSKFVDLKTRHDELFADNRTLSRAYQAQRAEKDEQEAKEKAIKASNSREAQMCVELGDDARDAKDYVKAEKFYKKAVKLDFDLSLADLMEPIKAAKEAERLAREKYKEAEREIERLTKMDKADGVPSALRVMQLTGDSTLADLKKSFVKFSRLLHPDKCPLSAAKEAFQVIERSNRTLKEYFEKKQPQQTPKTPDKQQTPPKPKDYTPRSYEQYKRNNHSTRGSPRYNHYAGFQHKAEQQKTAHQESEKYRSFNTPPRPSEKGDFWTPSPQRNKSRPNGRFGRPSPSSFETAFDKW